MRQLAGASMTFRLCAIQTFIYRAPIAAPVCTSFGTMHHRPALIVRVHDDSGGEGWGEIWCNWPPRGAEHRAALIHDIAAPLVIGQEFDEPSAMWERLTRALRVLGLQTGEPGPLAHVVAGLDISLWDLWARRQGVPLWRLLGGEASRVIPVYASGINPDGAVETVARCREAGYRSFKVKVGFDSPRDRVTAARVAAGLNDDERFMVDANQGWDLEQALRECPYYSAILADWIEEPLPADSPQADWCALARAAPMALAAGENLIGEVAFREASESSWLTVVQPDICKWGGFTGCQRVAAQSLAAGKRYCPHYLGGGLGLLASAHLLAAVGGDGVLEVDVNFNPLREAMAQPHPVLHDGAFRLSDAPGLGVAPDLDAVARWQVDSKQTGVKS